MEIETEGIEAFRRGTLAKPTLGEDSDWVPFALACVQETGKALRSRRLDPMQPDPRPELENLVVRLVAGRLRTFCPAARLLGADEAQPPSSGWAVALDAIDGSSSFASHSENCCTTFAVFKDGQPFLGVVANPVTGEIGWSSGPPSRLLQLPLFGEPVAARDLPLEGARDGKPLLISLHPYRRSSPFHRAFYDGWNAGYYEIQLIKSPSGSPSWALLEAAKGHFVYVNVWDQAPAAPHDLAAAVELVRAAGGHVVGIDGRPIQSVGHRGLFVAGVQRREVDAVLAVLQPVKANLEMLLDSM